MTTATTASAAREVQDLGRIIRSYHEVTERLKSSHELLSREVCRLRDQLDEKNRELARRERLAALGEMAAGVAHEIRNPLAGIELYVSLLEGDLSDQPEQLELVRRIGAGVRNLEGIVNDTLSFAHGAEPTSRAVPCSEIVDRVLAQAQPRADAVSAKIEVDDHLRERALFCDASQIERALLNLVLNALEAGERGGCVRVADGGQTVDDRCVRIVVEDDGPGIAADQLEKVFNPFFTTKDTGTGLGLAIVHSILEAHGGWIRAGNRKDGGAAFTMAVPRYVDSTVGEPQRVEESARAKATRQTKGGKD
jgi:signal transduction histidine kinase